MRKVCHVSPRHFAVLQPLTKRWSKLMKADKSALSVADMQNLQISLRKRISLRNCFSPFIRAHVEFFFFKGSTIL